MPNLNFLLIVTQNTIKSRGLGSRVVIIVGVEQSFLSLCLFYKDT